MTCAGIQWHMELFCWPRLELFPFFWRGFLRYSLSECAALFWWISPLLLRPFGSDLPVFGCGAFVIAEVKRVQVDAKAFSELGAKLSGKLRF